MLVALGRPADLPPIGTSERKCGHGYGKQTTFTGAGRLEIRDFVLNLEPWMKKSGDVAKLVAPIEWSGIVQARTLSSCPEDGSAMLAFGPLGLQNYRRYSQVYLPWRKSRSEMSGRQDRQPFSRVELQLAALVTADVDGDFVPELIAYTFATWIDKSGENISTEAEVGVVWQASGREPAVVAGMMNQPGEFSILHSISRSANGGVPALFAVEYCCAGTSTRWTSFDSGEYRTIQGKAAAGEWQIFVQPSPSKRADLFIDQTQPVDWNDYRN